jgi:hypothetical protein
MLVLKSFFCVHKVVGGKFQRREYPCASLFTYTASTLLLTLYTVKKGYRFSVLPTRESLVSESRAGEGKYANLFLQCRLLLSDAVVLINFFAVLALVL